MYLVLFLVNRFLITIYVEDLSLKKRHAEAARVLMDYSKDLREAVIALVQGNSFSEARRIVCLSSSAMFCPCDL